MQEFNCRSDLLSGEPCVSHPGRVAAESSGLLEALKLRSLAPAWPLRQVYLRLPTCLSSIYVLLDR